MSKKKETRVDFSVSATILKNTLLEHMVDYKKEHPQKEEILAAIKKKIEKSGKSYHAYDCKNESLRLSIDYKNSQILIICENCNGQANL